MSPETKQRLIAISTEIRAEAFMAGKAKSPREHFNRINTLSREACDYFNFGMKYTPPAEPVEPESEEFGFTCGVPDCPHDQYETDVPGYPTMREALDAAEAHRLTHAENAHGIVTHGPATPGENR